MTTLRTILAGRAMVRAETRLREARANRDDAICEAFKAGTAVPKIAEEVGLTRQGVWNVIVDAGLHTPEVRS